MYGKKMRMSNKPSGWSTKKGWGYDTDNYLTRYIETKNCYILTAKSFYSNSSYFFYTKTHKTSSQLLVVNKPLLLNWLKSDSDSSDIW